MITVYAAMYVILGFLLAAFLLLLIQPAYRRRIERFAVESVKRSLPLSEDEIKADKDRIRAQFAIDVHNLERKLEDSSAAAARQSVEINRRDAKINDLEQTIAAHRTSVEEHENARRVLEQAILDRLPKVEQRLAEARKLLVQRDREILLLTDTGAKQAAALEEATQINVQQREELARLKTTLQTRAARNRETVGDPRFDGEVALKSELEALRAKSREQAALIEKLQKKEWDADARSDAMAEGKRQAERLKTELAAAEARILALESDGDGSRAKLEARIKELEAQADDQMREAAKMRAALKAFSDNASEIEKEKGRVTAGLKAGLASRVELSQLQAELEQSRAMIDSLKAEVASSNERLVRQAEHFREELRRLGSDSGGKSVVEVHKRSLAERIAAPRAPVKPVAENDDKEAVRSAPGVAVLKAVNGSPSAETDGGNGRAAVAGGKASAVAEQAAANGGDNKPAADAVSDRPHRRPRLLDRISSIES